MPEPIKKFLETAKKDKKHTLLMVILVGILILIIAWPISGKKEENAQEGVVENPVDTQIQGGGGLTQGQTVEDYVALQEERLQTLLESIGGAGRVEVMITAHSTREKILGKDYSESTARILETDSSGGTRTSSERSYDESVLYAPENDSPSVPYVVKELTPEIEGVVVAATGAGDEYIVDEITQAVSVLFGLPVHKIKVVKMEA